MGRRVSALLFCFASLGFCQQTDSEYSNKHILLIIPNYRSSATLAEYKPLSVKDKFMIAKQDSFDRGTVALAAAFAGVGQLSNSNPSYGQGVEGYAKRIGASYADFTIGNFMTEGVFPSLLHQDPRYFRRAKGSFVSRLGYSVGQIAFTHNDSGHTAFNFSELLGNSAAVAISTSYSPDSRTSHDAIVSLGTQLLVDATSNVLKEFWPDVNRKFSKKHTD